MTDFDAEAADILANLPDGVEISQDDLSDELQELVEDYTVPLSDAKDTLRRDYSPEDATEAESGDSDSDGGDYGDSTLKIAELDQSHHDRWFNIEAEVLDIWDGTNDKVAQKGLLGDDTGKLVFTIFQKAADKNEDILLEEGETYALKSVVGEWWEGELEVKVNSASSVEELDKEFEPPEFDAELAAPIVRLEDRSGLIKRCPEDDCGQPLQNGRCKEHGEVDGDFDLRLKTIMDDGHNVHHVLFGRETTAEITGIDMDEARNIAEQELDTTQVASDMEDIIVGRYYHIRGQQLSEYIVVDEFEEVEPDVEAEATALIEDIQELKTGA